MYFASGDHTLQPFQFGPNVIRRLTPPFAGSNHKSETIGQGFALQKFHNSVINFTLVTDIVECADIGMVQRRNGAGLAVEALFGLRILRQMGGKNLDGDSAVESGIACAIHLTHAASP